MALEPITRQEQIIAGKELEPITRMEKFLKEYGGTPKQKPLGELVLTNENCAHSSGGSFLSFNGELQEQVQAVLDACKTQTLAPSMQVSIGDFYAVYAANYYGESATLGVGEGLQFFIMLPASGLEHVSLTKQGLEAPAFVLQAVDGGYPMTIKVYVT